MRNRRPQRNKDPVRKWTGDAQTVNYWRERAERHAEAVAGRETNYEKEIDKIYLSMFDSIQRQINDFYQKYASDEGITMSEARKRVSKLDIAKYSAWAEKYVKNKDFSPEANERMKLYNLAMKINRLEMLKSQIGVEMADSFNDLQDYFDTTLTDEAMNEYRYQAGLLGTTVQSEQVKNGAKAIAHSDFYNATWSERLWTHQDALKGELERLLEQAIIGGRGADELARELEKKFGASRYNARRLMITEIARVQTEVAKDSMERNGNKYYYFLATGPHPCEVCKSMDGNIYNVADMMPGENADPMHPLCHCCTAPAWNEKVYQSWLNSGAAHSGVSYDDYEAMYG